MKTKQVIGIVVASCMFVFICIMSMLASTFFNNVFGGFFGNTSAITEHTDKYVGIIRIEGEISSGDTSSLFETSTYDHNRILDTIDCYIDDSLNKGIMLYINSPGGSVMASDEVYLKLMQYKEKTKRPIWVYMGETTCSGGYYIAMAADHIIANRNTTTGSIGVYVAISNYEELYKKLGIKVDYIKTGDNKTMGASTETLTPEQQQIYQSVVDEAYEQFVDIIDKNRTKLNKEQIKKLADGRIYTAKQALKNGLIDEVATYEEAVNSMKKLVGKSVDIVEDSEDELGIWESITGIFSNQNEKSSKSESEVLLDYIENNESGVAMYYAMPE